MIDLRNKKNPPKGFLKISPQKMFFEKPKAKNCIRKHRNKIILNILFIVNNRKEKPLMPQLKKKII